MSRFIRSSLTGVLSLFRSAAIKARPGLAKYRYPACSGGRTLCSKITTEGFGMSDQDDALRQYGGYRNRLGLEKSPYLLQHANNPVDWYTWGREAFDKAKAENKPIFLSVGYSTCHWCHVMERESFEDEEIGKMLNDHFVPVKMDREERPDIDKVYMTFLQATEGSGGWPMSVWMTPDLKPFYGGTYFPPDDRYHNRPGFKTMLQNISKAWSESQEKIEEQGTVVLDALARHGSLSTPQEAPPAAEVAVKAHSMWAESFDKQMGGFSKAPKFPQPTILEFMFAMHGHNPGSGPGGEALNMALLTLDKMAKGGIHDHVGQGFHRYSTDEYWHVPHFEKMLYDQGQLASVYATGYQISHQEELATTLRDILLYVGRDLSDMEGGFYSAEDADSYPTHDATDKKEGAFCVWTQQEINTLLPEPLSGCEGKALSDLFSEHYNVRSTGNVDPYKDPHDELKLKNVLTVRGCLEDTAETFGLEVATVSTLLAECRERLMAERRKRPAPHLDNKMITSWNALMISGYAKAAAVLDDQNYLERAALAAQFLERNMYSTTSGILLRSCYAGEDSVTQIETPIEGFVDDYAFLIKALLDLYEAGYQDNHLQWAERLQAKQDELFWDPEGGGYFTSGGLDQHVVLRLKEDQDGAEPSSNSVSAHNLLRLSNFLDTPSYRERAEQIFKAFALRLDKLPVALPGMLTALLFYHSTPKQIIVVGDPTSDDTRRLLRCVHSHYLPNKVLMVAHGNTEGYLYQKVKVMESLTKVDGKATAYVCENFACSLPVNSVEGLEKLLTQQ